MSVLDRYILRQCLGVMAFVTAVLTVTAWLAQSLRLVDLIVNRGLSAEIFAYLALLILPRFLDIVLPIGTFIAVLFVFNRLSSESELVVMRAAGLGPFALAKPVFALAAISAAVLMSLSIYFLPASNREFKDMQFEIRNRFVASLLQEGTFTNISDQLTIFISGRDPRGEVTGLVINDDRDPKKPVTITAERGAFAENGGGSRIVMVNGTRQQYDRTTGKLSVLSFNRYTLDLNQMRDAPQIRVPEAQERYLPDLFFPPASLDPVMRHSFVVEGHERLLVPLSAFGFAVIPLACLLPGQINRRGQVQRILLAVGLAFLFQSLDLAAKNLAGRYWHAIPLIYLIDLLPLVLGFGILLRGGVRLGFRRPAAPALAAR